MKKLQHLMEALLVKTLFTAFRVLPLDVSSYVGGFMARAIGPYLKAHRIAKRNLAMAFPDMPEKERQALAMRMWDHLGRVVAEFANLPGGKLLQRMEMSGIENLPEPGQTVLFISGHFGNWDLTYPIPFSHGVPLTLIYRHANNPHVDRIINDLRAHYSSNMFPKGPRGAIRMAHALKKGESLALLVDQKMNDGIPVPFFGRDAMTAPAVAQLALRWDMPIIPVRTIRTKGAHFKGEVLPPLLYEKTGDMDKDALAIMTKINAMLESWIREHPEQWFWVHKRWPD